MTFDLEKEDILKLIKESDYDQLDILSDDIRDFLVDKISKTGGHLASNLGVVELTVAMHKVYNAPEDKMIFDVGHQAYVHKIITGRADRFDTLRQYKGLSGFPKSKESEFDSYDTGHSATSLSAAAGFAAARDLQGENYDVIAMIGDGSMTGGLAYEALNNIGNKHSKIRIILNDNGMSIASNVGAMSKHLSKLRTSQNYLKAKSSIRTTLDSIPVVGGLISDNISKTKDKIKYSLIGDDGILFEELGIKYIGPVNGHDIKSMVEAFRSANAIDGPTIVHVITKKGKGYSWAEKYPRKFHGVSPFNIEDGKILSQTNEPSFSKVFGQTVLDIAKCDERVVTVSAAMGTATGLLPFCKEFPDRYFDVGIAESHAVVFAAGLSKAGLIPVVAIYSSFLQRAYDQIMEDVCLQDLHVVFAIDRAGLVGSDGETHHGQFDISYLNTIPKIRVMCPADGNQLAEMLEFAVDAEGPVAIRYPRGGSIGDHLRLKPFTGENIQITQGKDITILAVGAMLDEALKAAEILRNKDLSVGVTNVCTVKPFVNEWKDMDTKLVLTVEDNILNGGFGEMFDSENIHSDYDIMNFAIPDRFVGQGSVAELRDECKLSAKAISEGALKHIEGKA